MPRPGSAEPAELDAAVIKEAQITSRLKQLGVIKAPLHGCQSQGDFDTAVVWAGKGVDLIKTIEPAAAIVARLGR